LRVAHPRQERESQAGWKEKQEEGKGILEPRGMFSLRKGGKEEKVSAAHKGRPATAFGEGERGGKARPDEHVREGKDGF